MALPQKIVPTVGEDTQKLQEKQKRFLIKKGFSDENYTRPIPQMTYGGTDTRDVQSWLGYFDREDSSQR